MADTFGDRMISLGDQVGHGTLTGRVEVDQVYAHVQHEELSYHHPRGGGPLYLQQPLYDSSNTSLQRLADHTLDGDLTRAMADSMEELSDKVAEHAPVEFDNLRRSGHPTVTSDGAVVYDRPPQVPRLTEDELRAEDRNRITERRARAPGH